MRPTSFVVLAGMRTGSNYLEESLNRMTGLRCWGEAFNPYFAGHEGRTDLAGVTLAERDAAPERLLQAMRDRTDGIAGFRFFADHDARVFDLCIDDPACAKIVLDRNPLDSFLSLQIARETGQWRVGRTGNAKSARITFDAAAFAEYLHAVTVHRARIARRLQIDGQTAFRLDYDDLAEADVLGGLARWLGVSDPVVNPAEGTRVQNPAAPRDRVDNPDEMAAALCELDAFDLDRVTGREPDRGPAVPGFVTAIRAPLLYMPVRGGPDGAIRRWLAALDGATPDALETGRTRQQVRRWLGETPGRRAFTVVRHPVARAHAAFCRHILGDGPETFHRIRAALRDRYGVPIPEAAPGLRWTASEHRAAFAAFLAFLRKNLGGQTGLRVDPAWASQAALVEGMGRFLPPDTILREADLPSRLPAIAADLGLASPDFVPEPQDTPYPVAAIHDAEIEAAARVAYRRDYEIFGFGDFA